jgi:hypothetical protein
VLNDGREVFLTEGDDVFRAAVIEAERLMAETDDFEHVLFFLRDAGLDMMDSMKALLLVTDSSLGEAKKRIHRSRAWAEGRGEREQALAELHQAMLREFGDPPQDRR